VISLKDHFDADSLYDSLKEQSRIARGTVYRTLPLLLQSGVLQMSVGDGKREYYEAKGTKGHHDHMYCIDCHKVIEFHSDNIEAIQAGICAKYKFEMSFHDHRIYGYCLACKLKK
jgi:Fur family transcriptional regulator, ferric uptake regulator